MGPNSAARQAIEINALWYNALRVTAGWLESVGDTDRAAELSARAARIYGSFNERFWSSELGYCYDIVDKESGGNDPSLRPNRVLSISLPHAVLSPENWQPVFNVVSEQLLTPCGLCSLAPTDPNYKVRYDGDLRRATLLTTKAMCGPGLSDPSLRGSPLCHHDPNYRILARQRSRFTHYYSYIRDETRV